MNIFWASLLGMVQGFTEFLPVSSSGHLVIVQSLIPGFTQPGIVFDVVLHAGTLLAVIIYFRQSLFTLPLKYIVLLVSGALPAALIGFLFQGIFEDLFSNVKAVGAALLITSAMCFLTDRMKDKKNKISLLDSLTIGFAQAIAIVPGVSRSGSTIFAGKALGIEGKKAAEFSFLLSIPTVAGANILQFVTHQEVLEIEPLPYLFGFVFAAVAGYVAIKVAFKYLNEGKFKLFGVYTFVLGILVMLLLD